MTAYLLERAWLGDRFADDVLVEVEDGRFASVTPDSDPPRAVPVRGLVVPGLADTHSHAFHRALRGRTQRERGSFWTWRDQMYAVAARLDPDTYLALARATYREMAAAGITCVGEFHYLHHQPDGTPYVDPDEMGAALVEAARQAGIRITLLDTLYLSSGFGAPPEGAQVRYSDGSVERWVERVDGLEAGVARTSASGGHATVGAAVHSVRAVPADDLGTVASWVGDRPFHVHLSEQVAENTACLEAYGVTPTRLLADHGLLRPTTSLVHATHLTDEDVALIGRAGSWASFCPTTERDLGDGIGPSRRLHDAGARLTLGSDSHAVIDLFEEMRAVELDERLATQQRGHWTAAELLTAATTDGHASLGWPDAGAIAVGQRADLVVLDPASPRTAGTGRDENTVVFAAVAEDVRRVMADGRWVVEDGDRAAIGRELDDVITRIGEEQA
ncbi:formimidoylglutamate deiminase [Nocardioides ganghwensis]|uniref:Formimidoylglutamate deiminase n=1 Tax=Nocardioides ganghwensis TaxID=252230 RepID=A0A4Q2SHL9_9ACTN|nr:formimidoylglutamate deiminase [Nocardioides ganghwensis]MBD3945040.1 formimidoylglutamate deiminase [Nocardioides ganghwensis]RYC04966.1 formimidoylglutamate deiminase [Nocardioides ganghwensis]